MTPFATGYTEALRASLPAEHRDAPIAPATVERIITDCEAALADQWCGYVDSVECGAECWRNRQAGGVYNASFPPLTVYLSGDDLIMLRAAGE